MRERTLAATRATPTRPLAIPSRSQRGWPRIRRMIAAQPPATTVGPRPNGMIRAPFPESDQPLPARCARLTMVVSAHNPMPVSAPTTTISPVNHRSLRTSRRRQATATTWYGLGRRLRPRADRLIGDWPWSEVGMDVVGEEGEDVVGHLPVRFGEAPLNELIDRQADESE